MLWTAAISSWASPVGADAIIGNYTSPIPSLVHHMTTERKAERAVTYPIIEAANLTDLVANTGNDATMYEHSTSIPVSVTRRRCSIGSTRSAVGVRASSHRTRLGRPPTYSRMLIATAGDGLVFLQVLQGLPRNAAVRRALLAPYLSPGIDRNNHEAVDTAIEELVANRARFNLEDINGDGMANNVDALLFYHVRPLPELVGNGRSLPGFDRYRTILIVPYLDPTATGTEAEEIQLVIDRVYGRSP